jgi:hypothetical protein
VLGCGLGSKQVDLNGGQCASPRVHVDGGTGLWIVDNDVPVPALQRHAALEMYSGRGHSCKINHRQARQ